MVATQGCLDDLLGQNIRAMGGSGLGLAISKEVVQLHGGKIWVNSIENKGSTFFISLPYVPFEEDGEWDEI